MPNIKIIGGNYKGKIINFPNIKKLRPTLSIARERLFNWLMYDIKGSKCLDAFSGSGSLGFEAYSRGAKTITFIEISKKIFINLKKNALSFKNNKFTIINENAISFLKKKKDNFNIIFLDPPFKKKYINKLINTPILHQCLYRNGLLYTESNSAAIISTNLWKKIKFKKQNNIFYGLYMKI
ncbi:16S rRNA (guanine(966)-N(2))-methyltransferase RsmD [Candidatus Legionella polyplacis]|uniref:Ribosomal RNA small subunit methyltransferase D n=1 Tax=Candidatus Legionella polyplacis TaxID=2005262 RepID=A0ABZ2GYG9_9GAMM